MCEIQVQTSFLHGYNTSKREIRVDICAISSTQSSLAFCSSLINLANIVQPNI